MAHYVLLDPYDLPGFGHLRQALRGAGSATEARPLGHINLDVRENDTAYIVDADLPGVAKEHIHVDIDGNRVEISAEVQPRPTQQGECVRCRERHEGLFYRGFTLDHEIDVNQASARYANGVLELVLPKKRGARARQITIA